MPSRRRLPPRADDRRPPLARLESLLAERNRARSRRILFRIRWELDAEPNPGPWIAAARALHQRGLLSDDAVIYFVEIFLECITFQAAEGDSELLRIREAMDAIERAHGLGEDEYWRVDEAPPEWRELSAAWDVRADAINVAVLRELGHADLAGELERDARAFEERGSSGYHDVWGADDEMED